MTLLQSDCPDLTLVARGKVRDVYRVDYEHLLFVATDRLSAFDVVLQSGIPDKGKILTQLSLFWFQQLQAIVPHHCVTSDVAAMPAAVQRYRDQLHGRSMLVRQLEIIPVEAIVRGYIAGSGWVEYQQHGTVCDIALSPGLQQCDQLPQPLFTPSTKAAVGDHDENISPQAAAELIGADRTDEVARTAIAIYQQARCSAADAGIIIADTKFEFGLDRSGTLILADEALTPDSSRFWPADSYQPGRNQASFDKQFVRDYLLSIDFDKSTPIELPDHIVAQTRDKYLEAFRIITGHDPDLS